MLNLLYKNQEKTKEEQYDDTKEGNPLVFVPTRTMKDVYLKKEIQMANLKIFKLVNFEGFLNLQILWLNGNKLSNIKGLHKNFRIKELYLHSNKFQDLNGNDFAKLKNLEVLTLNNNKLNNLQKTINVLNQLKRLKTLDLYDNPIESQPQYRRYSVLKLKQIDYFDKLYITKQERKDLKKNKQILNSQREYRIDFSKNEKNLIQSIKRRLNKSKMKQKENQIQQKILKQELPKREDNFKYYATLPFQVKPTLNEIGILLQKFKLSESFLKSSKRIKLN